MECSEVKNVFLWGNFYHHCRQARSGKNKVLHITIAIAEFFPVVSQVISLIEYFLKVQKLQSPYSLSKFSIKPTNGTPILVSSIIKTSLASYSSTSSDRSTSSSGKQSALILGTKTPTTTLLSETLFVDSSLYDKSFWRSDAVVLNLLETNSIAEVTILIKSSKDVVNQRIFGKSLLEWAAYYGYLELVRLLVESGAKNSLAIASTDLRFSSLHMPEQSALLIASLKGHTAIVEYLLDNGAADEYLSDLSTVLSRVAQTGNLRIMKLIVAYEPVSMIDSLTLALEEAIKSDNDAIYTFLVNQGASNKLSITGDQLLLRFASLAKQNLVKRLIRDGGNINVIDEYGVTVLHFAAGQSNKAFVSWLLANGADTKKRTTRDIPLGSYPNGKKALIKKGSDYQAYAKQKLDFEAQFVLSSFFEKKNQMAINLQTCLANLISIDTLFQNGNTLLHYACKYPSKECLELAKTLLEKGIQIIPNNQGKTPLECIQDSVANLRSALSRRKLMPNQVAEINALIVGYSRLNNPKTDQC